MRNEPNSSLLPYQEEANNSDQVFQNKIVGKNSTGPLYWGYEELARETGTSVRHLKNLVSQNKIPYAKMGRRVVFVPERIREWLSKGGTR